jgi:hypothetical protein
MPTLHEVVRVAGPALSEPDAKTRKSAVDVLVELAGATGDGGMDRVMRQLARTSATSTIAISAPLLRKIEAKLEVLGLVTASGPSQSAAGCCPNPGQAQAPATSAGCASLATAASRTHQAAVVRFAVDEHGRWHIGLSTIPY